MLLGKFYRRHRGLLVSLSGMIMLIGLLICAAPVMAQEAVPAAPEAKMAPCKGLKPYNNLDELLYQFYINLDSDCLFEMSVAELEEMWGIKILDEERFKPKNYYPLSETDFYYKPYSSEKDAFYVQLERYKAGNRFTPIDTDVVRFTLKATEEWLEKYQSLFPEEKMPELLPEPNGTHYAPEQPCMFPQFRKISIRREKQVEECVSPAWTDSIGNRSIVLSNSGKIEITYYLNTLMPEKKLAAGRDEVVDAASADIENTPCRGLRPYKDLDDLLYQIYINLDSECLFKMPIEELEAAWDTKIYAPDFRPGDIYLPGPYFREKPYRSGRDAFYLQAVRDNKPYTNRLWIEMTREYSEKKGSFYPDPDLPIANVFPKMLPAPQRATGREAIRYSWFNSDKTRRIILSHFFGPQIKPGLGITGISVHNYNDSSF